AADAGRANGQRCREWPRNIWTSSNQLCTLPVSMCLSRVWPRLSEPWELRDRRIERAGAAQQPSDGNALTSGRHYGTCATPCAQASRVSDRTPESAAVRLTELDQLQSSN